MFHIPTNTQPPLDKHTVLSLNQLYIQAPLSSHNVKVLNTQRSHQTASKASDIYCSPQFSPAGNSSAPILKNRIQKGQKISLDLSPQSVHLDACLGWNCLNSECDVDVSAFLLAENGKVPGDEWFVFYGQPQSPDKSTIFSYGRSTDKENISINLSHLNPCVSKIVFVLTIHEALKKNLNFSMISDAYIRILDHHTGEEVVSFQMDEYYSNVTSMMIGELYLYRGNWKFHAIGNGVARDLEGLCKLYGVQVN